MFNIESIEEKHAFIEDYRINKQFQRCTVTNISFHEIAIQTLQKRICFAINRLYIFYLVVKSKDFLLGQIIN